MLQEVETSNCDRRENSHCVPVRKIPLGLKEKVDKMVKDLLAKNIIRESESPWNTILVFITKANGDMRLCVDYR